MEKSKRCTATCMVPGCYALIRYDSTDNERPLYCSTHMVGREHRGYKKLTRPKKETSYTYRCPRDGLEKVSAEPSMNCPICGSEMVKKLP